MTPAVQIPDTTVTDTAFIIGPGRSGTTLLYKLLCLHPEVAYVSSFDCRLPWLPVSWAGRFRVTGFRGKLEHWFLSGGNAYLVSRKLSQKLVPMPVEGEAFYRRFGLSANADQDEQPGEFDGSPLRAAFSTLRKVCGKALFVSKRTANNRRLPLLDAIFPSARFINLSRDGRDVAASLSQVAWWNDHPLWWDAEHRTPLQASAQGTDMLGLCAQNWVAESEIIEQGLAGIDPGRVLDIRFANLVAAPVEEMRRLLKFVGLDSTAEYERAVTTLGLGFRPSRRHSLWNADQLATVNHVQGPQLERQGYRL